MTQQPSLQTAFRTPEQGVRAIANRAGAGTEIRAPELAQAGFRGFGTTEGVAFAQVTPPAMHALLRSHDRVGVYRVLRETKYTCNTPWPNPGPGR
jgi:hypothetical protein